MVEKSGNDATYVGENEIWGDKEEKEITHTRIELDQ